MANKESQRSVELSREKTYAPSRLIGTTEEVGLRSTLCLL